MCCFCWNIVSKCWRTYMGVFCFVLFFFWCCCFCFVQIEAWAALVLMTCYFFTWKLFYPVTSQLWNVSVEDAGLLIHTNARVIQWQPCIFLFEAATWFSQNKDMSQAFSSCSAFVRKRRCNMNFSGFWKRTVKKKENSWAKVLCLSESHQHTTVSQPTASYSGWQETRSSSVNSWSLLLIQSSLFFSSSLCKQQLIM